MSARVTGAPNYIAVSEDWRPLNPAGRNYLKADERAFRLRRASKPRPGDVFLVLGDLEDAGDVRFEDLAEVAWCDHAPYAHDLAYRPVRWK